MSENTKAVGSFIGYEYRSITVSRDQEALYADGYQNFGWSLDDISSPFPITGGVAMKFRRDRKIRNKAELTRLQRQFDACVNEINSMEKSKESSAFIASVSAGLIGTAFIGASLFSFLNSLIIPFIILAVPGLIGWVVPYFLYKSAYAKKTAKILPLVENKYDEIYEICERAGSLLGV